MPHQLPRLLYPLSILTALFLCSCGDDDGVQSSHEGPTDSAVLDTSPEAGPTEDATIHDSLTEDTPDAPTGPAYREPDTPAFAAPEFGKEPGVIFRWRADGTSTSPGTLSEGVSDITVERPAPFSAFRYQSFAPTEGNTLGYLGSSAISAQSIGFTVQAWFRARSLDGWRSIFSNAEDSRGFCLKTKDGYLQSALTTSDSGTAYRHWVQDNSTLLEKNRWYHAAVSASKKSDHWRVALFLDHEIVHEKKLPFDHGSELLNSTELPAVAGEPGKGKLVDDAFDGDIHALVVHNYPIGDDQLGTRQLREAGRTFGLPSYHDYLQVPEPAGTATASPPYSDRRYNFARRITMTDNDARFTGLRSARARLGIPFLNDRYVPNGVAVSGDGKTLWMSFSYQHDEGGNPNERGAFLAEIDLPAHEVQKVYRLHDTNGAEWTRELGGLTWAPTGLYLTLGNQVVRFDTSEAILEEKADPDLPARTSLHSLQGAEAFDVRVTNAAIAYDPHIHALWLAGNVALNSSIERYDLTTQGAIERPSPHDSDQRLTLPSSIAHIRGLSRLPTKADGYDDRCFLLSSYHLGDSSGSKPSRLIRWCDNRPAGAARLNISGAAQALALGPDETVWVVAQSGSAHLQKRKKSQPWYDVLTPYLIGFEASVFEPTTVGCKTETMIPLLGDLHSHTSYSDGIGTPQEMFALARDQVGLDFLFVTDHVERLWKKYDEEKVDYFAKCKNEAKAATQPNFLALCDIEIATQKAAAQHGHANIFFAKELIESKKTLPGLNELYDKIVGCKECLSQINHPASVDYPWIGEKVVARVDKQMALAELNGATGTAARAMFFKLLDGGWHVAPTWNSDTHSMNPAAGGRRSGLYATALTEAAIKEAITDRRTFAGNTGNGGFLALHAEGCWMGVRLKGHLTATFRVRAEDAEVGFSHIVLRSLGGAVIHTFDCAGEKVCDASIPLDIDPAQRYVVADATRSDGKWIVSAPVWLED